MDGVRLVVVPHGRGSLLRLLIGVILMAWMVGWFAVFTGVLESVTSGEGSLVLVIWLLGWSGIGAVALFIIIRVFGRGVPERLLLNHPSLSWDTGIPPFRMTYSRKTYQWSFESVLPRRSRYVFGPAEIETLALRQGENGHRLTIDQGGEQLEMAARASEGERQWLFEFLKQAYARA